MLKVHQEEFPDRKNTCTFSVIERALININQTDFAMFPTGVKHAFKLLYIISVPDEIKCFIN